MEEAGTAYYVVVQEESGEPSVSQITNGNSADGSRARESGSFSITDSEEATDASAQSAESIPYTYRRDSVNGDRNQIPFFVREDVLDAEQDFLRTLEDQLGEEVYKSDAREAAIVLAHQRPELICDILREWGYDLD